MVLFRERIWDIAPNFNDALIPQEHGKIYDLVVREKLLNYSWVKGVSVTLTKERVSPVFLLVLSSVLKVGDFVFISVLVAFIYSVKHEKNVLSR